MPNPVDEVTNLELISYNKRRKTIVRKIKGK
jgi:hypothetical protein